MKFILKRAQATQNAQITVQSTWIWDDKPVLQWDTDIKALRAQQTVVSTKEADMMAKRGVYVKTLDDIHARTVQAVAMFKVRYKHTPEKLAVVQNLSARGDSRDDVLTEARELTSAWNELDPTWAPTTANTLAALQALCVTAVDPQGTDFGAAKTAWRSAGRDDEHAGRAIGTGFRGLVWRGDEGFSGRHTQRRHDSRHHSHHDAGNHGGQAVARAARHGDEISGIPEHHDRTERVWNGEGCWIFTGPVTAARIRPCRVFYRPGSRPSSRR